MVDVDTQLGNGQLDIVKRSSLIESLVGGLEARQGKRPLGNGAGGRPVRSVAEDLETRQGKRPLGNGAGGRPGSVRSVVEKF
ncbi:hypothetical protein OPT61_g4393 [Boeremia exigua]|uniref:Uncharacterized protein n=1 Tax=Boeremia exigua TaxID=749465 RepID=A0ACC2IEC1_9PLEO|nr:hypothetical protein OPT61_g4393 [Boeremia exigua]